MRESQTIGVRVDAVSLNRYVVTTTRVRMLPQSLSRVLSIDDGMPQLPCYETYEQIIYDGRDRGRAERIARKSLLTI